MIKQWLMHRIPWSVISSVGPDPATFLILFRFGCQLLLVRSVINTV